MFFLKMVEVPVQVFGWVNELKEIKWQFFDKVGKVLDLRVCVLAELPKDADVDVVGTVTKRRIRKYSTNPIKKSTQNQPYHPIGPSVSLVSIEIIS